MGGQLAPITGHQDHVGQLATLPEADHFLGQDFTGRGFRVLLLPATSCILNYPHSIINCGPKKIIYGKNARTPLTEKSKTNLKVSDSIFLLSKIRWRLNNFCGRVSKGNVFVVFKIW
jgi:hypothetical protein